MCRASDNDRMEWEDEDDEVVAQLIWIGMGGLYEWMSEWNETDDGLAGWSWY